jgi:hypothetical protein
MLSCVGRGLCDELVARLKESYHGSSKIKKHKEGGQDPSWVVKTSDDEEFCSLVIGFTSCGPRFRTWFNFSEFVIDRSDFIRALPFP